jgi:DNA-binding transcriptional MerR regulator
MERSSVSPGDDGLVTIGRLARLSGLSIKALRHYDAIGLLPPANVHPGNGYRRYVPAQVESARLIRRLRDLDVPLAGVRSMLAARTPAEATQRLAAYRSTVQAQAWRLQRILHRLDHAIDEEGIMPDTTGPAFDPEERRQIGVALFNAVWTYLEMPDRTQAQDDLMVHMAHASRYHWEESGLGGPENNARGEWQVSRVYSVVGRPEPALYHARRCLEICQTNGIGDFDLAFAYEALARASAVAGDGDGARRFVEQARGARDGIAEADDLELFDADIATIPI